MKKTLLVAQLSMLMVLLALGSVYAQSSNPGNNPPPQPGWYCPYCGSYQGGGYGMGPGMMRSRGYGYGMGPGMMAPGQGYYGPNPHHPYTQQQPKSRSIKIRPSLWLKTI